MPNCTHSEDATDQKTQGSNLGEKKSITLLSKYYRRFVITTYKRFRTGLGLNTLQDTTDHCTQFQHAPPSPEQQAGKQTDVDNSPLQMCSFVMSPCFSLGKLPNRNPKDIYSQPSKL